MHEFKFEKALYKTSELIKIVSISKATFYRFVNSWIAKGNDPALMGKVKLNGSINWLQ